MLVTSEKEKRKKHLDVPTLVCGDSLPDIGQLDKLSAYLLTGKYSYWQNAANPGFPRSNQFTDMAFALIWYEDHPHWTNTFMW